MDEKKMNDQDDFFDDMIDDDVIDDDEEDSLDDELEWDDAESFEESDESPLKIRTVLLVKNDMIAVLGLKTFAQSGMIVRSDPRQNLPTAQTYDSPVTAAMWFKRSLATSMKNGWTVLFDGEPLRD